MSPRVINLVDPVLGFPRVSGDEPAKLDAIKAAIEFSPRERG